MTPISAADGCGWSVRASGNAGPLDADVASVIQVYLLAERPESASARLFLVAKGPNRGKPLTAAGLRTIFRYHRGLTGMPTLSAPRRRSGPRLNVRQHGPELSRGERVRFKRGFVAGPVAAQGVIRTVNRVRAGNASCRTTYRNTRSNTDHACFSARGASGRLRVASAVAKSSTAFGSIWPTDVPRKCCNT
ncbi:hypothetical protein [Saccharopolyspora phatthalungensis]|uniref:Uncharacterized protein n=1 Tax=Saccharopolyspora phatthalungensis TaxID=664693 RepID=A0A840QD80_9PSEU|nr:hypothetical protein [Saccharopolyspora phatthalungensis]MBB5156509.1 hypothetical protein [Saccharopolyspora phatthalungensis]